MFRYLALLQDENPVRTFGEYAGNRTPGPLFMSRERREGLRPICDDVVRAINVLATFFHPGLPFAQIVGMQATALAKEALSCRTE